MTKKQRFGLITLVILIIAAYLVTTEPWLKKSSDLQAKLNPEFNPEAIRLIWPDLSLAYPYASQWTDTILRYTGFDLAYNESYEQAAWVAYVLSREELEKSLVKRSDDFRSDTSISTGSAELVDYRGSGFDRGHLAPAADMQWSPSAMSESFLLSNMSPQHPSFNRGIWKKLEEAVRSWAMEKDSLFVITGPVLSAIDSVIGKNEVGVPRYYFKVLVDLSPPEHSMLAFLMPNEQSRESLFSYAISVDSLEGLTGIDFFADAPDQQAISWLEGRLESEKWLTP